MSAWLARIVAMALLAAPTHSLAHETGSHVERLPVIGPAPDFVLTSQDGKPVSLGDYRGRVVAVTFVYASCTDTCPVLTALMVKVQQDLGPAFGSKIVFVSITVDPERDTPDGLREYAKNFDADLSGWAFLTGSPAAIHDVTQRYGVFVRKTATGDVDHTFLTSLIDANGSMPVQYLGYGFDPEEFRHDLLNLADEHAH